MRIISNNIDFDLPTGFAAEFTRNNVMLTDAGEQTSPITLPGTAKNLKLVQNSDRLDNYYKPLTDLTVTVIDGLINRQCNMGIHTANEVDGISCTLYFDSGDFYSKVGNTRLNWLSWPIIKSPTFDSQTLAQRVQYLIDMLKNEYVTPSTDNVFSIRAIITSQDYTWKMAVKQPNGSIQDQNITGKFVLNAFEKNQIELNLSGDSYLNTFEGEYAQRLVVDGNTINLAKGYGMTPFLKLRYVIDFIFNHFGYSTDMSRLSALSARYNHKTLLLNNVADAIYSGILNFKQLVPDVTIKEFLAEIEKNYCGKFVIDEVTKKSTYYLYNSELVATPDIDFSKYITLKPKTVQTEFNSIQVILKSDTTSNNDTPADKSTTIEFDLLKIGSVVDNYRVSVDNYSKSLSVPMIIIADIIHLNSSVVVAGVTTKETATASTLIQLMEIDNEWEYMMVNVTSPYGYKTIYYKYGKQFCYFEIMDEYENRIELPIDAIRYFYKTFIDFKLNSNIPLTAEMNIPAPILEQLKLHTPKLLNGQPILIESLKYALGKKGTQTVTMRTLRNYADRI